jgi:hypothetical protein
VLLALPAASVIMVLLRYLLERYRLSDLYTKSGRGDPVVAEVDVKLRGGGKVEVKETDGPPEGPAIPSAPGKPNAT